MEIKIEPVKEIELFELAKIYDRVYNKANMMEKWTAHTAFELFKYYYKLQPEIFLSAKVDNILVGAIMSVIKPYYDGIHIEDSEIFVDVNYQRRGIGTMLYKEHFKIAKEKYNTKVIEIRTYSNAEGEPLKWYKRIGFNKIDDMFLVKGNIDEILNNM